MSFYKNIITEFLNSNSCNNRIIYEKVFGWYGYDIFVTNNTSIHDKPIDLVENEDYFSSKAMRDDVDLIIEFLITGNDNDQSSLEYLVRLINDNNSSELLSKYPKRKKGSLFQIVLAKALFGNDEETKKEDVEIYKVLISVLVRRVCDEFKKWFESAARPSEKYKLLGKFNAEVVPINSPYFVDIVNILEADKMIQISEAITETDIADLMTILGDDKVDFIQLAKKYKDETLSAIYRMLDNDISNKGVYNFIAQETLNDYKGDNELYVAKLINSSEYENSDTYKKVFSLIAGMSLKSICGRLQEFIENERNISSIT